MKFRGNFYIVSKLKRVLKKGEVMNMATDKDEFDSEFSNVKYMQEDNIVFFTWKKYCCYDNYRTPTIFALELLKKYPNSNFVVDARNGFEDEKEDAAWGFSVLLPAMSNTDCKNVVFIMNEVNEIEEEMDMWTKEFMKYFTVHKVKCYGDAIKKINEWLLVNVTYTIKTGKRKEFFNKLLNFPTSKSGTNPLKI